MARIRVLLVLLVTLSGVICNVSASKEKETKRIAKPVEYKQIEKKSSNGKRESAELPAYTIILPLQQQSIHTEQIYGAIEIVEVETAAAPASVSFKLTVDPFQQQQQLQHQTFTQFYHPVAAGYTRYSQRPSEFNGSDGISNPVEVPSYEAGSFSALRQGPLYSSPSSTNNPGNTYSEFNGNSGGKMTYTNGLDPNYEGHMYALSGATHYGTHIYKPSRHLVQIGSNRVTVGSEAIAGVFPPSYNSQQQSPANASHGGRGSSSSILKFA